MGDQLGSLPLVLRALVISGLLVVLMANLVMPLLARLAERWLSGRV
jgi:antibiotic biosynthesis monooxygenase (ABM) superfamily enzyme